MAGAGRETNGMVCSILFFFQAEDGIRDIGVTGVQTCALPILPSLTADSTGKANASGLVLFRGRENVAFSTVTDGDHIINITSGGRVVACGAIPEIGRASCRERV